MRGSSPRRRGGPLLPLDEGREAGFLAAERHTVSARSLAALPKLRGSFGTGDAASPAPPGSVPKVGCPVFDRAKIPRPKRRGLRGNMVPFPAALCAAGTPMGWTLVAPFLELPPSCAALAALANRARPAVRCRTAFPQKCRDGGPGGASSLPVGHSSSIPLALFSWTARRPILFSAAKPPRPFWAAPQVRRLTQGARVSGDRSLSNSKGAPAALCAVGNKENGGPKALPLGEERSAAFGRKEKFGPLCGERKGAAKPPPFSGFSTFWPRRGSCRPA